MNSVTQSSELAVPMPDFVLKDVGLQQGLKMLNSKYPEFLDQAFKELLSQGFTSVGQ